MLSARYAVQVCSIFKVYIVIYLLLLLYTFTVHEERILMVYSILLITAILHLLLRIKVILNSDDIYILAFYISFYCSSNIGTHALTTYFLPFLVIWWRFWLLKLKHTWYRNVGFLWLIFKELTKIFRSLVRNGILKSSPNKNICSAIIVNIQFMFRENSSLMLVLMRLLSEMFWVILSRTFFRVISALSRYCVRSICNMFVSDNFTVLKLLWFA